MTITFVCPNCERRSSADLATDANSFECLHCGGSMAVPPGGVVDGQVRRCLVCPSRDLFLRKDFPQRLGVLIVAAGFAASSITWAYSWPLWTYAILFATALIDVVLYVLMPDAVVCYHCGTTYRGLSSLECYSGFDLETHERHRQQQIRMAEQRRMQRAEVVSQGTTVAGSTAGQCDENLIA
jgi:hypothetical protein